MLSLHITVLYILYMKRRGVKVIIHENVPGFPKELLRELLGDDYSTTELRISPDDCGSKANRRDRVIHLCLLKKEARLIRDIEKVYECITHELRRQ